MFSFFSTPKILPDLDEELFHTSLKIEGSIPKGLSGTYVRNGPINIKIDSQSNRHWFDGLAMLHSFTIDNGSIFYTNKFIRTDTYKKVFKQGSLNYPGFATSFVLSPYEKLFKRFNLAKYTFDNANQNITCINRRYAALAEIPFPVEFDLKTLETLGLFNFADHLPHENCRVCSHPHIGLKEHLNYLIEFGESNCYLIFRQKEGESHRELIAKIPVHEPSYMHSFAVTENYVVLTEFPLILKERLDPESPYIDNFKWEPQRGTYFLVVNRQTGELVGRYQTVPFFAFHHANAFEIDGSICIDIVCYDDASIISKLADHSRATSEPENRSPSRLVRFTLSLTTGETTTDVLFKKFNEFPNINTCYDGKPYRYLYLTDGRDATLINEIRPLYKLDVQTKEFLTWSQEGCYPSEPVFVNFPDSSSEDEGIILSVVLNAEKFHSFLLILDAKNFKEIGRAIVPHVIPLGLHGRFFADF